ncbi:hypothetical protein SAMN02745229_03345 [Butyrivibrio fibrisolvens DSM 3071]|uniref:Uncharacterized protein n=1 Tax=Butyrivibrio fibrisolvens DSM 3071 TaxID=1121131 RepID=A0A1M6CGR4_BUTFI|nr:hypothetical protein [Butyrivibrio fibrisolvens]SHI60225.1 hypothetical protein SAMN02745229_03345 [Butyrivibrio fibrisolvens DSM 3071]
MSVWDYVMPHRLLINKSLRKEAEGLRVRVDAYQIEYDRRVEECQEELNRVEAERQEKLLHFRDSLEEELQGERSFLESVAQDITSYADAYLHRNYLFQMRDIKRKQIEILQEDNDFLSNQMILIGEEIDNLRERQRELTSFTDVKDIIRLISLSGYKISFEEEDDAKKLLDKVSEAISSCELGQDSERFALVRLKGIIQERSEYLPTISYIAWVIQQKIQFSKQLSDKRSGVRDTQTAVRQEIKQIEDNIKSTSEKLESIAKRIRFYWAHPITYLSADISYAYKEKSETGNQLRDVGEELHNMASLHSDDQDKWERLQCERRYLSSEMDALRDSISSKKKERSQWFEKRDYIFKICKKYGVLLIPDKKNQTDEDCIIADRLVELNEIRTEGVAEAKKKCEQEKLEIISRYNEARTELEEEVSSVENKIIQLAAEYDGTATKVSSAEKKVKQIKDGDDRFFLVKIFSETPGLDSARKAVSLLKKELAIIGKNKADAEKKANEIKDKIAELDKKHERDLRSCIPRALRPTAAEAREEKKLVYRKEEIEKRRKEGGYENKN